MAKACDLCSNPGGELIWQDEFCRVVMVDDMDYPGFCRVILNSHITEMTDLARREQERLMAVVFTVERAVRDIMQPDKINLASLGNMVPHMHWHVIPRYKKDRNFPNSIWDKSRRESLAHPIDAATAGMLKAEIQKVLG
ncbi:MAG: HIT family protein [Pseudomonadota bacterium]